MGIQVLIVDDEKDFAETLKERLTVREFDAESVYEGSDAIDKVNNFDYDVVILDVQLPGISGIDILREIKRIKPLTEVIMLTGHATVQTAIEGMKLGAFDFLLKPVDTEDLNKKLTEARKRKKEQEDKIMSARINKIISSPRSVFKMEK